MTSLPIHLPSGFIPLVQEGDSVTISQPLAKRILAKEIFIHIAQILHTTPEALKNTLLKNPSDVIKKGDSIAEKKSFFTKIVVRSNVSGTFTRYDRSTGSIILQVTQTPEYSDTISIKQGEIKTEIGEAVEELLRSPLDGQVSLCNNEQIVIKTDTNVFSGEKFIGTKAQGVLRLVGDAHSGTVDANAVVPDLINAVLLGHRFTREALQKALGMDVLGVIAEDVSDEDLEYFTQKRMTTPLIRVSEEVFTKLSRWDKKPVYIDATSGTIILLTV